MSKVLIKSNKTNVMSISTGCPSGEVVQIVPGPNEIDSAKWEICEKHPDIKRMLGETTVDPKIGKVPVLEVLGKGKGKAADADGNEDGGETGLSSLNVKNAKALVKETFNTVTLKTWLEDEGRAGVVKEIEKQLEAIEKEREENEKENEGAE